jgi:hypothetical protein
MEVTKKWKRAMLLLCFVKCFVVVVVVVVVVLGGYQFGGMGSLSVWGAGRVYQFRGQEGLSDRVNQFGGQVEFGGQLISLGDSVGGLGS